MSLAFDVSGTGKTQINHVDLGDGDKNWGKRVVPLGTPTNIRGLDKASNPFLFLLHSSPKLFPRLWQNAVAQIRIFTYQPKARPSLILNPLFVNLSTSREEFSRLM